MLSLANVSTGASAASYYEAADDYYADGRSPSQWWGLGAAELGLAGDVNAAQFAGLLDGRLPTGEQLHHAAAGRRGGTDATFSAPKSVSLQALIGGDRRLIEAHQRAVDRALAHAETLAACRVTEDGQTETQVTSNLVVARFEHDLSRACDPQLHTHCVIVNATRRADGQWRALNNEPLYRHKMLLGALYRAELAREVQALGYAVRSTHLDGRFELAHIHEAQIKAFSQRSAAVEAYLQDQGQAREQAGAWLKQRAAIATRERKTAVDRQQLREQWSALSAEQAIEYRTPAAVARPVATPEAVQSVLGEAVAHLAERRSVFEQADLLGAALARGVGRVTMDEVQAALAADLRVADLVHRDGRYTTAAAQQREREILAIEAAGRDRLAPIHAGAPDTLEPALETLSDEQRQAARAVLSTRHQVLGIQGRAGVGKTTLLAVTTQLAQAQDWQVRGLAPSASAARELASTGMAAETLAAFERRATKGLNARTLLVLDEAGMASSLQMHAVLMAARDAGCRVLLVGDTAQLAAVEAGKPFAQLQQAGMATAVVSRIQRQRDGVLKQAVEHAVAGQVSLAVELLHKEVTQIVAASERWDRIAQDYVALPEAERAATRVIVGTRRARAEINRRIRQRLGLSEAGPSFELLSRKDLTAAERRSTLAYEVGDVVQADKAYASLGLQRGDQARVVARLEHRVVLRRADGVQVNWQPAMAQGLSVFTPERRALAVGESVRITANDRERGLINGELATVSAIDAERQAVQLRRADGHLLWLDGTRALALDHGYCSTVHSAQGQTCEQVLIEADTHSLTANQNTFYVAISRARQRARIYTDDREMLPLAMGRTMERAAALEVQELAPSLER